jgi:methionyl-tRNA formyltransferase
MVSITNQNGSMLGLIMRIVFMGSPDFAVPSLNAVAEHFELVGVITQPDRPSGRGRKLTSSSVKTRAEELELPIFQPISMKHSESEDMLRNLHPSLVVVAAYGKILPQSILDIPTYGTINVHASLLPRWRGAAPVQASILNGDDETGITLMLIDAGMDTGPVLSQRTIAILHQETGGELTQRLAELGAEMLPETISQFIADEIHPTPQDEQHATYAPMLKKVDGFLDFTKSAMVLERQVRAFEPWPGSYFLWGDLRVVVRRGHSHNHRMSQPPGKTTQMKDYPAVFTSDGILVLDYVQPAGKRMIRGDDFLRGAPSFLDTSLDITVN